MNIPNFNDIKIKDYIPKKAKLENGLPIYSFNNSDMEMVFMKFVFFNAGTINQKKFFTASLTKTQLAQDTKDLPFEELSEQMDYYGIDLAQTTSNERTILNFSFLKRFQKEAIKLIEQIVLYPLFSQDKLNITINNCKQDFQAKCSQTSFLAHRDFMSNLFGKDSPYGKYAKIEDYDKVQSKDLMDFYRKHYSCNQCYIILSGNVDNEFIALVNSAFGINNWNMQYSQNKNKQPDYHNNQAEYFNNQTEKLRIVNLPSAVQASICMGKFLPDIHSKDYIPLTVLNCLFGGYFNSRLMSNIREDKGYTYGINSFIAPYKLGSIFMIVSDVTSGKDTATIDEIKKEIIKLQEEEVFLQELNRVKHYLTGEMLRNNDGVIDISETYDSFIRFNLPDDYNSKSMEIVRNMTPNDIETLANKYLNTDNFTISIAKNND